MKKSGPLELKKLYNYLYKDATIYLNRKHKIWEDIVNE